MNFYGQSFEDLHDFCNEHLLQKSAPRLLFNWHYKKNQRGPFTHQDLGKITRSAINDKFDFSLPKIALVTESADRTVKFLIEMTDGLRVETVLIPFQNKYTICLSSQVGCAMGCAFCFTGTQGLKRNLQTNEIVGQFLLAKSWLTQNRPGDDRILNIVFMGQGEPLHNFEATAKAAKIFLSQSGLSIADHKITVSTSGYLPGLLRWEAEMPNVNIALSLHAIDNDKRSEIIPLNKKYPLKDIIPIIESLPKGEKRFVTYEYIVLKDFNDSTDEIHLLGKTLKGTKAFINLIPFNPFPGSKFKRPELSKLELLKSILESYNIPTTLRTTKGDEILAACGQLNTKL